MENVLAKHDQISVTIDGRIGEVVYCDELLITKQGDSFYMWWAVEGKYSHQMIYHLIGKYIVEKSKCDARTIAFNIIESWKEKVKKNPIKPLEELA